MITSFSGPWEIKPEAGSMLLGTSVTAAQSMLDLIVVGAHLALTHLWLGTARREGASQMQSGPPGHPPRKKA